MAVETGTLEFRVPRAFKPLLPPARFKGGRGGRGSAKSHFFAERMVKRSVLDPEFRGACLREVQRSLTMSSKLLIEDKIRRYKLGGYFRLKHDYIERRGGSGVIIFQGMQNHTAESIKSLEGFKVGWFEEAQVMSQRSLDLLTPTFRGGAECWFSWNPRYADDPIEEFMTGEDPHPESVCVTVFPEDNPWLPDDLRVEMEWMRRRDPEKFAHVYRGAYLTQSEARVFRNWRVEEFETPKRAIFYFGADWGFSIDPTVLIRCFIDEAARTLYVDREVYRVGCELDFAPLLFGGMNDEKLAELNKPAWRSLWDRGVRWEGVPGAREWPITADSARPETIAYMQRHGFPKMRPSIKGPGSIEEGIEFLREWDIVVHPRCKHTIDELSFYSYKTDPHTGDVIPVLEDKKNHVIDALRYAVERRRRRGKRAGTF